MLLTLIKPDVLSDTAAIATYDRQSHAPSASVAARDDIHSLLQAFNHPCFKFRFPWTVSKIQDQSVVFVGTHWPVRLHGFPHKVTKAQVALSKNASAPDGCPDFVGL